MKRILAVLLVSSVLLCACGPTSPKQHTATYFNLFDTVTTIIVNGGTETKFRQTAQRIYEELYKYHKLFDIYNDYEGINNLKTVNDQAGIAPVTVDPAIIALLLDCREYYALTDGKVNVAMGSVLRLWHKARSESLKNPDKAYIPDEKALSDAARHTDFSSMVIDEAASTVYIADPEMSLDVGAIAKGWACQRVAETAPAGMLISVGGNVCLTGSKDANGTPWVIGVQDPDNSSNYLHTVGVTGGAVVTSGDYQRTYKVDGKAYHHIIDPETQVPSAYWRSVTVVCADSGLADVLSTALFLLPLEKGQALAEKCGAQAFWLDASGIEHMTFGFRETIIEQEKKFPYFIYEQFMLS